MVHMNCHRSVLGVYMYIYINWYNNSYSNDCCPLIS